MPEDLTSLAARVAALEAIIGSRPNGCGGRGDFDHSEQHVPSIDPRNVDAMSSPRPEYIKAQFARLKKLGLFAAGVGVLSGNIFYVTVPANKTLKFTVDHDASFEVGVKITANDYGVVWRRNSFEPDLGETTAAPVTFERNFTFDGMFKRCWVGGHCAPRSWNPCPAAAIVSEAGDITTTYDVVIMWDDSRNPAVYRNIGCAINIS